MSKYKPGENSLTNNFSANMLILLVFFALILAGGFLGFFELSLDISSRNLNQKNVLLNFMIFVVSYFFTSYWFSPDLDIHDNRPGKGSFPFKAVLKSLDKLKKAIPILKPLCYLSYLIISPFHYALNFLWRWFWHPFGNAFTHRGVIHVPLIGTQIKILYILIVYFLISKFIPLDVLAHFPFSPERGYKYFLLGEGGFYQTVWKNQLLLTSIIGMSVADICHIAIDYYDMFKNGNKNFIPPAFIAPRGFLIQFFNFFFKRILGRN